MKKYSLQKIKSTLAIYKENGNMSETAKKTRVPIGTLRGWVRKCNINNKIKDVAEKAKGDNKILQSVIDEIKITENEIAELVEKKEALRKIIKESKI